MLRKFFIKAKAKINVSKIILICSVSFISRYLINKHLGINVFTEYSNWISIVFYLGFSIFIVFINELFYFYRIKKMPNFVWFLYPKGIIISKIRKKIHWVVVIIIILILVWFI